MFMATFFLMAEKRKQLKCPLSGEWINKMCYIYTVAYYLSIKRNEILIYAINWIYLENMLRSHMILFI